MQHARTARNLRQLIREPPSALQPLPSTSPLEDMARSMLGLLLWTPCALSFAPGQAGGGVLSRVSFRSCVITFFTACCCLTQLPSQVRAWPLLELLPSMVF